MGRNVKILTLLILSLFSFNLLAGADKKIQNVGSGSILIQTGGANTRMSFDSSGGIFMPSFTDTRFLIFGPSGQITESATFTSSTVTTDSNTQTLTNKTIAAGDNTISDLTHGSEVDDPSSAVHGVSGSVVGTTDAQALTNKDYDAGSASNTLRITLPKNTKSNLDGLDRKEGTIVYATDDKKAFIDNGTNLVELGGAGTSSKESTLLDNAGFLVTSATNAMTVALKQADGSSDPTVELLVSIALRGSSDTVGIINIRTVESALALVIPDGATLGTISAAISKIYIYAIDNAGTVELAVGNIRLDGTEKLISTTILNTSSDAANVLYSTVARASVSVRIIGFFESTQATAGTWASSATLVGVGDHLREIIKSCRILGVSGTPVVDSASGLCEGWVDSITDNGAGNYTLNITSNIYSSPPVCTFTGRAFITNRTLCVINGAPTISTVGIICIDSSTSAFLDADVNIICKGVR